MWGRQGALKPTVAGGHGPATAADLGGGRDACPWLLRSAGHAATARVFNAGSCNVAVSGPDGGYGGYRLERSNLVLWLSRGSTHRTLSNEVALVEAVAARHPGFVVIVVDFGKATYDSQVLLSRLTKLVVGMHGGAMWNAVRWMDLGAAEPQFVLEVLPRLGPGASCVLAKMFGVGYSTIACGDCRPERDHIGALPEAELLAAVGAVLSGTAVTPDCDRI
ncbi:unnamed protein product [Phaeothamnion confervicola]